MKKTTYIYPATVSRSSIDLAICDPAPTIAHISSSDHCPDHFQRLKAREEEKQVRFASNNLVSFNQPFSIDELRAAIHKAHDQPPVRITSTTKCVKLFLKWLLMQCCESSMIPGLLVTSLQLGQKLPSYQSLNREGIPLILGTTDLLH
jgi:hypothetical protein